MFHLGFVKMGQYDLFDYFFTLVYSVFVSTIWCRATLIDGRKQWWTSETNHLYRIAQGESSFGKL